MRIVLVSKALVVGAYRCKAEEIARLGVDLTVLIPPEWNDRRGRLAAEQSCGQNAGVRYDLRVIPLRFNGSYHVHYYPTLARELDALRPDLLHMDEEPYNVATWHGLRAAARRNIPGLFFTWQNLYRRYPWPFSALEQGNYRRARIAIAGNHEAADVLRRKGSAREASSAPLRIGYAGGLLAEKGIDLLLTACARLRGDWQLHLVGDGGERPRLQRMAAELGIAGRVTFDRRLPSSEMPAYYRDLDLFVLPSRTTPSWKEQFGRVLIEAMASEVPVIGSDSGEIPHVVGNAGLIFPEGNADALGCLLQQLLDDPDRRAVLGRAGRARVLAQYTMARIAAQTVDLYRRIL
jgi:glycosyltransferase involved in cell wall biosynthesis